MNTFYIFTLFIPIKVKSNSLNIFSRIGMWIIYRVFIFTFFATVLIIILFGLLIIDNNSDVVFHGFNSNELNRLRFSFIQVRQFFYSDFNFFLSA